MKRILTLFTFTLICFSVSSQSISRYIAGQNAWMPKGYGGAVYNGELDNLWPWVKQSKVQMVRIGGLGIEFNLPTGDEYVKLIDSIRNIGAEPMVQVPNGRGKYTASQAAAIVQYVNITKQRNVKYWVIGNEPNLVISGKPAVVDAAGVAAYTKEWSSAMKAVDPTILIVGPECSFYDSNYYPALLGGQYDITGKDPNGRYYVDVISFHHYPFNGTQTRSQVTSNVQSLAGTLDNLTGLLNAANTLHNRTGDKQLTWALTEFNIDYKNPAVNTVEGLGVHSFLNGQLWAEVFGVGMQKKALSIMPWSIHEMGGTRTDLDLGYLDGKGALVKPRSSFYHEMLIAENFKGNYVTVTDNQSLVTGFASTYDNTIAVMLINKSQTDNFNYTLQLSSTAINDGSPLKINVSSNINKTFQDKLFNQSTVVLLFNTQGTLVKKIVYSIQHAIETLPPTYVNPGERVTLVNFSADRTVACVVQDQEPVVFTSNIYGDYTSLNWDFGDGAQPRTASGVGPFSVTYTTTGDKTVKLTAVATDATIVINKPAFIKASSCLRSPYVTATIPGMIKAIEYDYGGEGAAYHDTEDTNRGLAVSPNVPRSTEGVDSNIDTDNGNVGWTENGEWLKYTVKVQKSAVYRVVARMSSFVDGALIRLWVNNVDKTGIIPVPKTSSWTDYQNVVLGNIFIDASPNATIKVEVVKNSFNLDTFSFTEYTQPGIVINRIFNVTSTADGMSDAVELLVTQDHADIRGLIIKDFDTNLTVDNGGKYQFRDRPIWSDLRKGTTIVLRKIASGISGYVQDTDASDFKIDMLFENTDYINNVGASGNQFNLTNTDMVLLKASSAWGADHAVHAFATNNGGGSSFYNAVTSSKLVSTVILNTGAFHYPLSPNKTIADFNGTSTGNSTDTNFNWGNGYGTNNVAYISQLRSQPPTLLAPAVVVNRVYNGSNDADGKSDAVELLVVKDHVDMRGLIIKDFDSNNTLDNGGKYQFNAKGLWQDVKSGTTIVLRKGAAPAGYNEDLDASDFTIDLLLGNTTYLTDLAPTLPFNVTQYDMVVIKAGQASGIENAIHAFATKGGGASTWFQSLQCYVLISPDGTDAGGGSFHYPLNPNKTLEDFNGTSAAISKSTALNWGYGFGQNNSDYIQSLRNSGNATPSVNAGTDQSLAGGTTSTTLSGTASDSDGNSLSFTWSKTSGPAATITNPTVASTSVTGLSAGTYVFKLTVSDGLITASDEVQIIVQSTSGQSPYPGPAAPAIPGTIEAENFDTGIEGVSFHDADATNNGNQYRSTAVDIETCSEGGFNVGWLSAGEWLEYTVNITIPGPYTLSARVASPYTGKSFHVEMNGTNISGTITVPNTTGWQNWQTVSVTTTSLTTGTQVMRIVFDFDGFNMNALIFSATSGSAIYRIKNRWQNTYLYDGGDRVKYSATASGTNYQWVITDVGSGQKEIKNVSTGEYMHVQNLAGYIQCTSRTPGWTSARWTTEDAGSGFVRIKNVWQTTHYAHLENLAGHVQHGTINSAWASAQWLLEPISARAGTDGSNDEEQASSSVVEYFPNEVVDYLYINCDGLFHEVEIVDLLGRPMISESIIGQKQITLDVHGLGSGLHLVRMRGTNEPVVFRVLKK